jgi:transketolase
MTTMRQRFYELAREALDEDERVAVVTAQIGAEAFGDHPRHFDVGIREQLMIGVAAGLALEGYRPVAHSYTPFLVERPYEMLKLDLGHNDLGAVLVSVGASYDAAHEGRTHQAPEDVALVAALPGWTIHVPGHPDEAGRLFRQALGGDGRTYVRLSEETNHARVEAGWLTVLRHGSPGAPLVVAVGPTLTPVLEATSDRDVTVAYVATVRPFPHEDLRDAFADGTDVVLVEPYLAGTSAGEIAVALNDRPHRVLALGVPNAELRHYGTGAEHRAAHGLDAAGIASSLEEFLRSGFVEVTLPTL